MLKIGIPLPAVKQALKREGKDVNIIDLDPEKPLSKQVIKLKGTSSQLDKITNIPMRKRLHWNEIDESKLKAQSFWSQVKNESPSLQLVGLDIENEEFASLFLAGKNTKNCILSRRCYLPETRKKLHRKQIEIIDKRRQMNGSILLAKFKVKCEVIARQVENMEHFTADGNKLRALMRLLPTKDESRRLRRHLHSIDKFSECEQYMVAMMNVQYAKEKFQYLIFRAEFEDEIRSIESDTMLFMDACIVVRKSVRFKKLLMYALKLGNALNVDGGQEASAITLDSLLKLGEVGLIHLTIRCIPCILANACIVYGTSGNSFRQTN